MSAARPDGATRVCVRGVDLHVEAWGSGPTLVVAHGLLGSVELAGRFGAPPRAYADHGLRVVAYDARGHGRSGFTAREADYRWDSHAADLAELLGALGLRRVSLLGGSMGAGSALLVALAHPELVERLVLVAPPPFGAALGVARRTFLPLALLYRLLGSNATARIVTALPSMRRLQRQNPPGRPHPSPRVGRAPGEDAAAGARARRTDDDVLAGARGGRDARGGGLRARRIRCVTRPVDGSAQPDPGRGSRGRSRRRSARSASSAKCERQPWGSTSSAAARRSAATSAPGRA